MASPSSGNGKQPAPKQPTTFYFAYGSNLHLKQMKRRCPHSRYIGRARLVNYRWQINERGYANVVKTDGYWVDGLVYEIDAADEAKLDINEGVSKNAYAKKTMRAQLFRAPGNLYRRPTSWIVDRGGPAKILRQAKEGTPKQPEQPQHWVQEVLVYISLNFTTDSPPKEEYINRINFGLADARALGMEDDYISNCIRPFVPAPARPQRTLGAANAEKGKQPARGLKRNASPRTGEKSPARPGRAPKRPDNQIPQQTTTSRPRSQTVPRRPGATSQPNPPQQNPPPLPPRPIPPLPPRPIPRYRDAPIIVVEEYHFSCRSI
ncbi:unnamed protein product [Clonostachys rosea f. rosea IK726]|uniref:gamma-glutamylcyclotransferase n=2 Tax=Bionectria ochroleuca TaxID=29856 RepID=A0A0B7JVF9_BIOOC|nr:unnamed protein product [Clonostachys rosea f. rosea IK726]